VSRSSHRSPGTSSPRAAIALALVGGLFIVGFALLHLSSSIQAYQECNPPPAGASCSYLDIWNLAPPLQLAADLAALALGGVVLAGAVGLWRTPDRHEALGLLILVASGASAIGYGGAIVGLFLGGLGGLLAFTHRSGRPARMAPWDAGAPTSSAPPGGASRTAAPLPRSLSPPEYRRPPSPAVAPNEPPTRSPPVLNPLLRPWNDAAPDELPPAPWPPRETRPTSDDGPAIPPELRHRYPELPRAIPTESVTVPAVPEVPEPLPLTRPAEEAPAASAAPPTPRAPGPRSSARTTPPTSGGLPALPTGPRRRPRALAPAPVPATPVEPSPGPTPPVAPDVAPAPPTPSGVRGPPASEARHAWQCAKCGLVNAPWSMSCTRCKAPGPSL